MVIRIKGIKGNRIFFRIGKIDSVPAVCLTVNQVAQSLIGISRIHKDNVCSLFVILAAHMVRKKRFAASAWPKNKLIPVRNDSLFHGQVGDIHMERFPADAVCHFDTEWTG